MFMIAPVIDRVSVLQVAGKLQLLTNSNVRPVNTFLTGFCNGSHYDTKENIEEKKEIGKRGGGREEGLRR